MNNLKEVRSKLGITQAKMASLLGVSQNYVAQLEIGRRAMTPAITAAVNSLVNTDLSINDVPSIDTRLASLSSQMASLETRLGTIEQLLLELLAKHPK